jgi:hypothetical protein
VVVNIVADDVIKAQETLLARQKKLNEEIKKTNDPKALADLNKQLKSTEQQMQRNEKVLKNELLPTYNQLTSAVKKYYAEFKKTGDPEVLKKYLQVNAALQQTKMELGQLEKASSGLTKGGIFSASFWANLAANGVNRATSAMSGFFRSSVNEALDADEATQRLSSTLSNLGRTDAFDRITQKAEEMAKRFRYLDNDDVVGVFNKLIDYGKLTEKEMNNLLPVIINFAAKSKISLDEATSVIVKALEGNGKALKEYGINIKDAGTETERLNVIMGTLKEKTDGAADAFQNSAKGGIAVARQELNNLKEDIGNTLIPVLNRLLRFVTGALKGLGQFARDIRGLFSGKAPGGSKSELGIDASEEVGAGAANEFLEKIKGQSDKERIKSLKEELSLVNFILDQEAKSLQQSKFDGKYTDERIQKNKELNAMYGKRKELLQQALSIEETSNKALGIDTGSSDKTKKKTKEIHELVDALRRLLYIRKDIENELNSKGPSEFELRQKREAGMISFLTGFGKEQRGIDPQIAIAANRDKRIAEIELRLLKERGRQKLNAEIELLNQQEAEELRAKDITEQRKLEIEERYRQKREAAEVQYWANFVDVVAEGVGKLISIYEVFTSARTNKENAELEKDRAINDKKARQLDSRLKKGIISQKEYDQQMEAIRKKQEEKEHAFAMRQFRRNQKIAIAQTLVNMAQGIVSTFAARPGLADIVSLGVARAIQVGLVTAAAISQIAAINAQKPQFAKGGVLGGRTHKEGGNAIVDGNGQKIAEIEKGEGIINRRSMDDHNTYTLSGTPSQIASSLNSMNGRGVSWTTPAKYMNYGAINKRYYAGGGVFGNEAGVSFNGSIDELTSLLARGIKSYVVLTDLEDASDRLNAIRDDATMK